jgi:cytochrome c oxidase cbb3-type subunit 4
MVYDTLRHFADSWGLVYLFCIFLGVIFFLLRPSAGRRAAAAALIPLADDREPKK